MIYETLISITQQNYQPKALRIRDRNRFDHTYLHVVPSTKKINRHITRLYREVLLIHTLKYHIHMDASNFSSPLIGAAAVGAWPIHLDSFRRDEVSNADSF